MLSAEVYRALTRSVGGKRIEMVPSTHSESGNSRHRVWGKLAGNLASGRLDLRPPSISSPDFCVLPSTPPALLVCRRTTSSSYRAHATVTPPTIRMRPLCRVPVIEDSRPRSLAVVQAIKIVGRSFQTSFHSHRPDNGGEYAG